MEKAVFAMPEKNKKIASDGVIGMILLLATEAMFFAGLISAYVVNRAGAVSWPPPSQPRLPVEITAANTVILLGSAFLLFWFAKQFKKNGLTDKVKLYLTLTLLTGAAFVVIQGSEWTKLIMFGLTTSSSIYGAFFYLIIGMHALHVIAGLFILLYLKFFLTKNPVAGERPLNKIKICSLYWYFVVGIWPILYVMVYLV